MSRAPCSKWRAHTKQSGRPLEPDLEAAPWGPPQDSRLDSRIPGEVSFVDVENISLRSVYVDVENISLHSVYDTTKCTRDGDMLTAVLMGGGVQTSRGTDPPRICPSAHT
jgi:hypothetical protein